MDIKKDKIKLFLFFAQKKTLFIFYHILEICIIIYYVKGVLKINQLQKNFTRM